MHVLIESTKHKIIIESFFWLLLQNRLNTGAMLRRRQMQLDSYNCELCLRQNEETLQHLFLRCSFANNCCLHIGAIVPTWLKPERATKHIKRALGVPFATEITMIMCGAFGRKEMIVYSIMRTHQLSIVTLDSSWSSPWVSIGRRRVLYLVCNHG
jgi:hypothetical protein